MSKRRLAPAFVAAGTVIVAALWMAPSAWAQG